MSKEVEHPPFQVDAALLQQLLDALPVGVWVTDGDGSIVASNPASRAIWRGERRVGPAQYEEYKAWWSATGKAVEAAEWGVTRAIATGEISHNEMIDIECFDGTRITILNSAAPIHDDSGQIRAAIAVNQDITDLKHAQDALALSRQQLEALSGAVVSVQEQERKRLSMELHDEIGQTLSALKIAVETARRRSSEPAIADLLQHASAMADTLVTDVREIARRLRPPPLDDLGLVAALRWHLDRVSNAAPVKISFNAGTLNRRLPGELELAGFRVIQEAVSNVIRHANAKTLSITLVCSDQQLRLSVQDDGSGFEPEDIYRTRGHHPLGLLGMRERTAMQGGELKITSVPGQGTEIIATFPLADLS